MSVSPPPPLPKRHQRPKINCHHDHPAAAAQHPRAVIAVAASGSRHDCRVVSGALCCVAACHPASVRSRAISVRSRRSLCPSPAQSVRPRRNLCPSPAQSVRSQRSLSVPGAADRALTGSAGTPMTSPDISAGRASDVLSQQRLSTAGRAARAARGPPAAVAANPRTRPRCVDVCVPVCLFVCPAVSDRHCVQRQTQRMRTLGTREPQLVLTKLMT